MPKRKTAFEKGNYYHIYNRGVNKQLIFLEDENYLFLLKRAQKYSRKFDVSIIAYCLMPNHYHFLVQQNSDKSISNFIQAIFNSYTKAFNKKHNRSGPLFEGRFRSIKVDKQNYLIHLCAYIHLNPIKAELSKKLGDWPFSNLPEWLDQRKGWLFEKSFRDHFFKTNTEYLNFLNSYNLPEEGEKYLFDYNNIQN